MKLITLMENTACREDLAFEHGLSLYLETGGQTILFDAGQSGAFGDNARKLGVDLTGVNLAVLSHGHYDHGGGLGRFLAENPAAMIYVNQHAFEPHYNATNAYIGLDPALEKNPRLVRVSGVQPLGPGLTLHTLPLPPSDTSGLQAMEGGTLRPEDFRHEQYLLVEERGRRILVSGCSHKGILQIAEHFRPDILIGGFHFMKIEEKATLEEAARRLLALPTVYYTGHCTGEKQYAFLKARMGHRLHRLQTGSQYIL